MYHALPIFVEGTTLCHRLLRGVTSSFLTSVDSHDAVLRFNAAPTSGYENDVGTKTTIRLVNSQVTT